MPATSQAFNAEPNPTQRSHASASTRSGDDERPKKSKKSKVQSENTRVTDSASIHSQRSSHSSPSQPDRRTPKLRRIHKEPKPKTKVNRRSNSDLVPETPPEGIKAWEAETEQDEEPEEVDAGICVGARRKASSSLGYNPSPIVRQPHRQGVSRLHLTRDVKVLPTVERNFSLPRSSVGFSPKSISKTLSEYIPSLGPSQSSRTSTNSPGNVVQPSIQNTAEVEATHSHQGTGHAHDLFPELESSSPFLMLHREDPRVQQFKAALSRKFKAIERETMVPLASTVRTYDVVEFQRLRDRISSSYQQLSDILDRYKTLDSSGLIGKRNKFIGSVGGLCKRCDIWLAESGLASTGPGVPFTGPHGGSETKSHDWNGKAREYFENGSQTSRKSKFAEPSRMVRVNSTPASDNGNLKTPPNRPRYYPVRKSLTQQESLSESQQGIEVQIPRRNPNKDYNNDRWNQDQAEWDRRYRREVTAGRIGGPYHTNPQPTPAAEQTASDRIMSVIPPDEFYRRPLEAGSSVSDKLRHDPRNLSVSKFAVTEGKNPNSTPQTKHDSSGTGTTVNHKESLASSSSRSHSSRQSQLALLASTDHCNESKEMKKSKHKHRTSGASQDISGHRKKRKRSVSHSATGEITASPLDRPSKQNKIKRRTQEIVPSNVSTGSESNKSPQTSISSSHARPSGCDSNLGILGRVSVIEKPDRNSSYKVNIERQSPESSGELSVHTTPGSRDRPQKHSRDEPSTTPSPPKKRSRKARSGHAKSSRRHDIGTLRDSSPLSEISLTQTPASGTRSKKRRKNENLAASSSPKRRRMTSQGHAEPSCGNTADHQIFAEEVESSVTPTPGPSTQSKGKGRVLTHSSGEGEGTHSGGIDDRGQDALEHLSPNIQRSKCRTLPTVPAFHRSRFSGRDTPWLEERVERKVKEILEKQHMPPPPNPLSVRPQNQVPSDFPGGQGLNDEQLVAIAKNKDLSGIVRFARAPHVFAQNGSFRAPYYYLKDTLTEEDWQRVAPRQKHRAPRPQADM